MFYSVFQRCRKLDQMNCSFWSWIRLGNNCLQLLAAFPSQSIAHWGLSSWLDFSFISCSWLSRVINLGSESLGECLMNFWFEARHSLFADESLHHVLLCSINIHQGWTVAGVNEDGGVVQSDELLVTWYVFSQYSVFEREVQTATHRDVLWISGDRSIGLCSSK